MKRNFSFFHSENAFSDNFFFTDWPMDKLMIWSKIHTTKTEKIDMEFQRGNDWIVSFLTLYRRIKSDHCKHTHSANIFVDNSHEIQTGLLIFEEKKIKTVTGYFQMYPIIISLSISLSLNASVVSTAISNGKWDSTWTFPQSTHVNLDI